MSQSDATHAPRFQYTGMQADAESGLLFDFRRYYDPRDGRFISQDPKGFSAGDSNLYRYVANNPLNKIDPTGLACNSGCRVAPRPAQQSQQAQLNALVAKVSDLQARRDFDFQSSGGHPSNPGYWASEISKAKQDG